MNKFDLIFLELYQKVSDENIFGNFFGRVY